MTPAEEIEAQELRRAEARERTRREVAAVFDVDPASVRGDFRREMLRSAAAVLIRRRAAERRLRGA